jgi:ABC-type Na+ efflux pump permease subunit
MSRQGDFWSRRKARVEAEAEAEKRVAEAAELDARDAALAGKTDEELCEELGLPDPDTLGLGDDFRAFMARTVPDRLRRRALRRLWTSNPTLANLDGLLDYADDYTDSAVVVADMKTTYQVGKGMLAHVKEMARQAEAEVTDAARKEVGEAPVPAAMAETGADLQTVDAPPSGETPADEASEEAPEMAEKPPLPVRRRMRFVFDHSAGATA